MHVYQTLLGKQCAKNQITEKEPRWSIISWTSISNYKFPSIVKTLPKAQQTRGLSVLAKVTSLGHILRSYTNFDQISSSESWPSINLKISSKPQHQNIGQSSALKSVLNLHFNILTKPCSRSLNKNLASKTWPNFSFQISTKQISQRQHHQV